VVPAAGVAVRFGGVPKELLPIDVHTTSLQHAVSLGRRLGDVVVITNREKRGLHRRLLAGVELRQQGGVPELWGALRAGLRAGRGGALIMADTVTDFGPLPERRPPLMFGVFETHEAHRFSVLKDGRIATKQPLPGRHLAWGMVVWSAEVTELFRSLEPMHYDRAFERAMERFEWATFPLRYYFDLGTFDAYRSFLNAPPAP
jgi:hypothetical protein